MDTAAKVAGHYGRQQLLDIILEALSKAGKDLSNLTAADLAPADEFHVGGLEATQELAGQMDLQPGFRLLDVGCGIGGPARYFAAEHGCRITGVDLTEEFVATATRLTQMVKLDSLAEFRQADATALPFETPDFDSAYMLHVGMNIPAKDAVFREVRRVLKPGGSFVVFDIMRTGDGPLRYPVPWAKTEETSFVASAGDYRDKLTAAGFRIAKERGRGQFSIEFMQRMMARAAQGGPPNLGLHLLMGPNAPDMFKNVLAMLQAGVLEPVEMFATAV